MKTVLQTPITEIPPSFDLTQIVNGKKIMTPSPFGKHQNIVFNLAFSLREYAEKRDLGMVFIPPLYFIFYKNKNPLQPHIIFIKKERLHILQDWIRGVPDMVVEVVSKGTVILDTIQKKEVYERYKVPECWLVFPELESVEVFTIANDTYKLFSYAEGKGKVKSQVVDGFEVDLTRVFD